VDSTDKYDCLAIIIKWMFMNFELYESG
jgi:hypothetical protein